MYCLFKLYEGVKEGDLSRDVPLINKISLAR